MAPRLTYAERVRCVAHAAPAPNVTPYVRLGHRKDPAILSGQCELSSVEVPIGGIMAKLIYVANTSLDGYSEDPDGGIDWGAPDEEYFSFINDLERSVGTYLYGRRMYEAMIFWETAPIADQPPWVVDFTNIWRAADKVVFSKTLASVSSERTTVAREFDVEAIRRMKADETR